ncbi:uncharacterized protein [Acropora muricata]|uniref:uncharacterized protein n=1 Tax=Acropora muricata TaxID=159855 RepID=UPI0034E38C9D
MADTAWRKSKDKVTAKRGKKRDAGDTTHKLLKGNELTVQRLSSEVSGKAKSRPEFVPFTEDELTIENIKRCCERHFAAQVGTSLVCDILAGEQSPSCKTLEQIADMKFSATIEVREKWKNLHSAAKREFTKFRQESKKTGGGPVPKEISATTSKVIELFQDTPSFVGLSGFETNCPNDQSVEEQSSGWSDVIVVSEVSEQPQSATVVSAEDVEQEKRCIVVQESEGKFKQKRKKITHDLVLEQQFNTLLLKQENLKLKKRKLELEVLLLEDRVKRETVVGQTMQPLTTINASPIFTNHFE